MNLGNGAPLERRDLHLSVLVDMGPTITILQSDADGSCSLTISGTLHMFLELCLSVEKCC